MQAETNCFEIAGFEAKGKQFKFCPGQGIYVCRGGELNI